MAETKKTNGRTTAGRRTKTTTKATAANNKDMPLQAIGMIETVGLVAAIEASDVMLKSADVKMVGLERKIGAGLVTVTVSGDVAAVKAAVETAEQSASRFGEVKAVHVIPRPENSVGGILPKA